MLITFVANIRIKRMNPFRVARASSPAAITTLNERYQSVHLKKLWRRSTAERNHSSRFSL